MKIEVPYSHIGGLDYPLVPITLKDCIKTLALVDSGASFSVFKSEVARSLKIDINKGKRITIGSISGGIPLYLHNIQVEVAHHKFKCKIGFSQSHVASINILGRDNFFKEFLVTFDDCNRRLFLDRSYTTVKRRR